MSTERVQKILAQAGIASRRKAEELITDGLVTINGKVAKLGDKAELGVDAIKVKGKLLQNAEAPIYLAFNKPKGVISMLADPDGRPTLSDYLTKIHSRVFPIGRLDFNSEGLILLTNDGKFTELLQKRDDIPRTYHVKVRGHVTHEMLQRLVRGMRMERKTVKPHSVRVLQEMNNKSRIEIVFLNSGAIDVKSFFEMKGFLIESMKRTAIGHITLHGTEPGHYKMLDKGTTEALLAQPDLGLKLLEANISKSKPLRGREERIEGELAAEERRKAGKPPVVVKPLFSSPRGAAKVTGAFGDRQRSDRAAREDFKMKSKQSAGRSDRSAIGSRDSEKFGPRISSRARPSITPLASGSKSSAPRAGGDRFDQFRDKATSQAPSFGGTSRRAAAKDKYFLGDANGKPAKSLGGKGFARTEAKPTFGRDKKPAFGGPSSRAVSTRGPKITPRAAAGRAPKTSIPSRKKPSR